jgi:uncharacterized integral membrane protein
MIFPLIVGLLLSIVALIFAFQNPQMAHVSFLFWSFDSSLVLVLVICFAGGLLAGVLMVLPARIRAALTAGRRGRRVEALESELAECKSRLDQLQTSVVEETTEGAAGEAEPQSED